MDKKVFCIFLAYMLKLNKNNQGQEKTMDENKEELHHNLDFEEPVDTKGSKAFDWVTMGLAITTLTTLGMFAQHRVEQTKEPLDTAQQNVFNTAVQNDECGMLGHDYTSDCFKQVKLADETAETNPSPSIDL